MSLSLVPSLSVLQARFLNAMQLDNCSTRTVEQWGYTLRRFLRWAEEREIQCVAEITADILAAYRRHLFYYRNPKTHRPLKFSTQASHLVVLRRWCRWLWEERLLDQNLARDLSLPKEEQRLPHVRFAVQFQSR